jgi:AAHS family 4-hydroxybenzoate transporter-like MFS transporter
MMIVGTVAFGLFTLATTQARSTDALMVLRFLTGIGLGVVLPCAQTMIAETCPRRLRSTFMVVGATGVTLGSLFAGVVAATFIRLIGWQGVFWVGGGASVLVALALAVALPETLDFLINQKRDHVAARALARRLVPGIADGDVTITATPSVLRGTIRQLFVGGLAIGTLLLWSGYVINLLVYSFMQSWMTLLIVGSGHTQSVAISATSVLVAGGILSAFVFGPLMDRVSPYRVLAMAFVVGGGVVALLGLLLSSSISIIFGSAFVVGFAVLGIQKGLNALAIYYYPLALRPAGLSWALGVGRIGQIAGPLIAGGLLGLGYKPAVLFVLAGLLMILGMLAMRTMSSVTPAITASA